MTIDELLQDYTPGHSDFQMDYFVTIKSGGTPYGCYKQSLREVATRYQVLKELTGAKDAASISRLEDVSRELLRFAGQALALRKLLGDLTPARKDELEREMWVYKCRCAMAVDFIAYGRMQHSTIELIHAMPSKCKRELVADMQNPAPLIAWYLDHSPALPEPEAVSQKLLDDIRVR